PVTAVDFKLRGRNFGVVLLVLEAHGALNLCGGVDEGAQEVTRQGVVVAAGVDVLKLQSFVIMALGVGAFEEEALNLVGGIEGVTIIVVKLISESLEHAADIAGVGRAILVDNLAENEHFAASEVIGRSPVEGQPVDAEAEIALALGGEA